MRGFYGLQFFLLCFFVRFTWGTEAIHGFHRTVLTVIGFCLVFQVLVKSLSGVGSSVFLSIGFCFIKVYGSFYEAKYSVLFFVKTSNYSSFR